MIRSAALLLQGDRIAAIGPSSRIENLAKAKGADEVDVSGKIVLPAFVETDAAVHAGGASDRCYCVEHRLRVSSLRKLTGDGLENLREYAKHGTILTGVTARPGEDPRLMSKLLKVHAGMQSQVTRICSVAGLPDRWHSVTDHWFRTLRRLSSASMVEVTLDASQDPEDWRVLGHLTSIAAGEGFGLRLRIRGVPHPEILARAVSAGPVAISDSGALQLLKLSDSIAPCSVMSFSAATDSLAPPSAVRTLIARDGALSLSAGTGGDDDTVRNMQHALFVATSQLKISIEEALTATTYNAACALNGELHSGSLEPGKFADLQVLDVSDYRDLGTNAVASNVELSMRGADPIYRRAH